MYKSSRDTAQWFDNDRKGEQKDRKYNKNQGPGKYDLDDKPLSDKRKTISWNFGSVPFGTCNERFKDNKPSFVPGPGNYSLDPIVTTKPVATKPQSLEQVKQAKMNSRSRQLNTSPNGRSVEFANLTDLQAL